MEDISEVNDLQNNNHVKIVTIINNTNKPANISSQKQN
jgi:hypothetical protein